jgi:hypothetical protein
LGEEDVGGNDLEMLKLGIKKSGVTTEPMKLGKGDLGIKHQRFLGLKAANSLWNVDLEKKTLGEMTRVVNADVWVPEIRSEG